MYKQLDITDPEHKRLINRIALGDTVLFLGAGFSLGAIGDIRIKLMERKSHCPMFKS